MTESGGALVRHRLRGHAAAAACRFL